MSVFPSQETRMGVDDSVEKALMVGDNGTIMQITQRRGQGQITHGFDFRAPRLRGQQSKTHYSFPHHYQGRIDFNTVNPSHSSGMDLMSIPASRGVLAILSSLAGKY